MILDVEEITRAGKQQNMLGDEAWDGPKIEQGVKKIRGRKTDQRKIGC